MPPPAPPASLSLFRPQNCSVKSIIAFRSIGGFPLAPRSEATNTAGRRLSRSRSRAGPRSHPEVRRGASRRRGCEWERPHTLSWCSAKADDAEWMSGKSRDRLAPVLTEASSWMSDRSAQDRSKAKPDEVVQTRVARLSGRAASRATYAYAVRAAEIVLTH